MIVISYLSTALVFVLFSLMYIIFGYWFITMLILSTLNVLNIISIPWFTGITHIGAISTPLFALGLGFILLLLSYVVSFYIDLED